MILLKTWTIPLTGVNRLSKIKLTPLSLALFADKMKATLSLPAINGFNLEFLLSAGGKKKGFVVPLKYTDAEEF